LSPSADSSEGLRAGGGVPPAANGAAPIPGLMPDLAFFLPVRSTFWTVTPPTFSLTSAVASSDSLIGSRPNSSRQRLTLASTEPAWPSNRVIATSSFPSGGFKVATRKPVPFSSFHPGGRAHVAGVPGPANRTPLRMVENAGSRAATPSMGPINFKNHVASSR